MVTYYNRKDLVSFGTYLLSEERKRRYEEFDLVRGPSGPPAEERLKTVNHADIENWLYEQTKV